jgi:hypothetical protein
MTTTDEFLARSLMLTYVSLYFSLNSDGQQFHQFQQNTNKNVPPQIIEYKNTMKYVVEEAGVPGENHRPWASNWYTLSLAAES